jgi:hypothetical protein
MRTLDRDEMSVVAGGSTFGNITANGNGNRSQNGVQNASRGGRNNFPAQLINQVNIAAASSQTDNSVNGSVVI